MFRSKNHIQPNAIDPDMPVDEIMRRWPATIGVMIRYGMLCVGCPIGSFHTVSEACAEHHVEEDIFVRDLLAAIVGGPSLSSAVPPPA